jgi:hypothetical protein
MALSPPNASSAGLRARQAAKRDTTASTLIHAIVMACTRWIRRIMSGEAICHRQFGRRRPPCLPSMSTKAQSLSFLLKVSATCPELYRCPVSQKFAPPECFARCEISGFSVLRHLLASSEVSGRVALPEFIDQCAATGKRALQDELEESEDATASVGCWTTFDRDRNPCLLPLGPPPQPSRVHNCLIPILPVAVQSDNGSYVCVATQVPHDHHMYALEARAPDV